MLATRDGGRRIIATGRKSCGLARGTAGAHDNHRRRKTVTDAARRPRRSDPPSAASPQVAVLPYAVQPGSTSDPSGDPDTPSRPPPKLTVVPAACPMARRQTVPRGQQRRRQDRRPEHEQQASGDVQSRSQADSAGSIPVTRSPTKAEVRATFP
jgi:hypothetical protein